MPKRNNITGAGVSYSKQWHGGRLITVVVTREIPRKGRESQVYNNVRFMYDRKRCDIFYLRGMMLMNALVS